MSNTLPMAPRVLLVARKPLVRNTRIFKQAKTLVAAGYDVVLVGLWVDGTERVEEAGDWTIHRVPLDPPHARLARRLQGGAGRADAPPPPVGGRLRAVADPLGGRFLHPLRSLDWNRRVTRYAERLGPVAIVHANDLDALVPGLRLARRFGVPLVYDAQELYPELAGLPGWYRRVLHAQERMLVRSVDRLIVVNHAIAAEFERRYRRVPDAILLNAPPFVDEPGSTGPSLRRVLGLGEETELLVYSGGLLTGRGLDDLVRMLVALDRPRAVLCFVGEGPERRPLEALAAELGVADRVRFAEYVDHEDVPDYLASADVGLLPYRPASLNHVYSSPSKLFHYLMAGLPVAGWRLPVIASIVDEASLGELAQPGDLEHLVAAVERVLADAPAYRARVAAERRRYTWEHEQEKLLEIYRSLGVATTARDESPAALSRRRP